MRFQEFRTFLREQDSNTDPEDSENSPQDARDQPTLTAGPPYPPEDTEAVMNMQTRLEGLGYDVGYTGIDGKYGPRTIRAVQAFKTDHNVPGSPNEMDANNLIRLNTAAPVENPTATGNEQETTSSGAADRMSAAEVEELMSVENMDRAKQTAEEFLGREMSDQEWNYLVRATVSEASPNQQERAAVMAVILNRVRRNYQGGRSVLDILYQTNQFQAVTGVPGNRTPSRWFTDPTREQVAGVIRATIDHLPSANSSWLNFTSNNPAAYGAGTDINFLYTMRNSPGARVIGGTVFGTV